MKTPTTSKKFVELDLHFKVLKDPKRVFDSKQKDKFSVAWTNFDWTVFTCVRWCQNKDNNRGKVNVTRTNVARKNVAWVDAHLTVLTCYITCKKPTFDI